MFYDRHIILTLNTRKLGPSGSKLCASNHRVMLFFWWTISEWKDDGLWGWKYHWLWHVLVETSWADYLTFLSLHFIICKMRIIKSTLVVLIQRLDKHYPPFIECFWNNSLLFSFNTNCALGTRMGKLATVLQWWNKVHCPLEQSMKWSPLFRSR